MAVQAESKTGAVAAEAGLNWRRRYAGCWEERSERLSIATRSWEASTAAGCYCRTGSGR